MLSASRPDRSSSTSKSASLSFTIFSYSNLDVSLSDGRAEQNPKASSLPSPVDADYDFTSEMVF